MEREQIINALEWCIQSESCEYCNYKNTKDVDVCSIRVDALALIKELTVELEAMRGAANSLKMHNQELAEENEAIAERYVIKVVTLIELDKQVQRLTEENERLREELKQRPPKPIITKIDKKENENVR